MSAAIIYLRVSTKKQEQRNELNLPAQQKRCEDWCTSQGIPLLKVFRASGESAWKTERPTLEEALDFITSEQGPGHPFRSPGQHAVLAQHRG